MNHSKNNRFFLLSLVLLCVFVPWWLKPGVAFAPEKSVLPRGGTTDSPAITIAGSTADTSATPSTAAREAHVLWAFGTVSGTYSTCTVQAKTSYDGTTYLTIGSAASVTVTSNAVNAWDIYQQAPVATGVTTTAVSSTAATAFGQLTKFTFACSSYGTSAPVTVSVIYR